MAKPKATPSNRAIGYVRVSTDKQDCSIELQTERIVSYCKLMGLVLDAVLIEADVSGKTRISERPEGSRIAGLMAAGACHVVALKLDRLFRNAADALMQCDEWQSDGVALHLVDMGGTSINTASAMGKMMLTMLAGFAEFERGTIVERTTAALRHKKATGKAYNHTPYGFQLLNPERSAEGKLIDSTLIAHQGEQDAIESMKAMRTAGNSYQAIADSLNARAIPTKTGATWHSQTVKNLIAA